MWQRTRRSMTEKEYQSHMAQARINAAHKLEQQARDMGIPENTTLAEYILSLENRIADLEDPNRYD